MARGLQYEYYISCVTFHNDEQQSGIQTSFSLKLVDFLSSFQEYLWIAAHRLGFISRISQRRKALFS